MLVRTTIFWPCLLILFWIGLSTPLYGQAITVNPNTLEATLKEELVNEHAFFVNGALTQGLTPKMSESLHSLGPMSRTLLTLTALRMHTKGLFSLDEDIARTLPNLLSENPFRVAITARHLMTETAGFAVPPVFNHDVPFKNYLSQVRTAGQITHTDVIGWRLLVLFMEEKSNQNITDLFLDHVLIPLGHKKQALFVPRQFSVLDWPSDLKANGSLIADLARLTVRNRDKSGARFLPPEIYEQLIARQSWRMHPIGPRRTLGGVMLEMEERTYIGPPPTKGASGTTFVAFPNQGIAFVNLAGVNRGYLEAIKTLAKDRFLPAAPDRRLNEAQGLYDKDIEFNGAYVRSDRPSAWLKDRLDSIETEKLSLTDRGTGRLRVTFASGESILFNKKAPFLYETLIGERLIFSPYRQGGYLVLNDTLYRYVGLLGNKFFVLDIFPLVILGLLSSLIHIRSEVSSRWRKMALYGSLGTVFVCAGLAADYFLWPQAVLIWDMTWLVNIWRVLLNIGLALVLSLPLFALSFTRKSELPKGAALLVAPLHLGLLSVCAFALFLILVAWGLAGEFSAY